MQTLNFDWSETDKVKVLTSQLSVQQQRFANILLLKRDRILHQFLLTEEYDSIQWFLYQNVFFLTSTLLLYSLMLHKY